VLNEFHRVTMKITKCDHVYEEVTSGKRVVAGLLTWMGETRNT
jgi:hypothetical protein